MVRGIDSPHPPRPHASPLPCHQQRVCGLAPPSSLSVLHAQGTILNFEFSCKGVVILGAQRANRTAIYFSVQCTVGKLEVMAVHSVPAQCSSWVSTCLSLLEHFGSHLIGCMQEGLHKKRLHSESRQHAALDFFLMLRPNTCKASTPRLHHCKAVNSITAKAVNSIN
jgi:hypothetical protein